MFTHIIDNNITQPIQFNQQKWNNNENNIENNIENIIFGNRIIVRKTGQGAYAYKTHLNHSIN